MNRESKIEVKVVDISSVLEKAMTYFKAHNPDVFKMSIISPIGYVMAGDDMYVLFEEGVGPKSAVTNESPLNIGFYGHYRDANGAESFDIMPVLAGKLTKDDILSLPVEKTVNLSEFIRSFGRQLEDNFLAWNGFLSNKMKVCA